MKRSEMIERLAHIEHRQWLGWATEIFTQEELSKERRARWLELFQKKWSELTDKEKHSDRFFAELVLKECEEAGMSAPERIVKPTEDSSEFKQYNWEPEDEKK